jgi:hypothetical protein
VLLPEKLERASEILSKDGFPQKKLSIQKKKTNLKHFNLVK